MSELILWHERSQAIVATLSLLIQKQLTLWRCTVAQKENTEEMKQQKMIGIQKCQSHLASIYLFFSKVLKSSSPESSFPSVLLQKNQPPAAKHINNPSLFSGLK